MISQYWNVQFLPQFRCKPSQFTKPCDGFAFFFFFLIHPCAPIRQCMPWSSDWRYNEDNRGLSPLCRLVGSEKLGWETKRRKGRLWIWGLPLGGAQETYSCTQQPTSHRHCLQEPCHEAALFSRESQLTNTFLPCSKSQFLNPHYIYFYKTTQV